MAHHLTRRDEEAADLVQETFLRALAAQDRFELRESGVRPWLFKILHNVFFTRLARDKRGPALLEEVGETPQAGDDQAPCWDLATLDWEQVDDRLKRAIDDLPPHYRSVLLLWAVEGLKYREIADVMGVAIGTVMSRLSRARALLARPLEQLAREHGLRLPQEPAAEPAPRLRRSGAASDTMPDSTTLSAGASQASPAPPPARLGDAPGTNGQGPVLT